MLVVIVVCFLPLIGIHVVNVNAYYTDSPYDQFRTLPSFDIFCGNNFHVILKQHAFLPVCVRQETATKLIERGWGITIDSFNSILDHSLTLTTDKKVYEKDELVRITIKNVGNMRLNVLGPMIDTPDRNIVKISDRCEELCPPPTSKPTFEVCCEGPYYTIPLQPNTSVMAEWDQHIMFQHSKGIAGNYTVIVKYALFNMDPSQALKQVPIEIK